MIIKFVIMASITLILVWTYANAQDFQQNNFMTDISSYQKKTSKGTRKYKKVDYNEFSQTIQFPIMNNQRSSLGSRGFRFDINTLPPTAAGSTKPNKPMKSRGTREHKSC